MSQTQSIYDKCTYQNNRGLRKLNWLKVAQKWNSLLALGLPLRTTDRGCVIIDIPPDRVRYWELQGVRQQENGYWSVHFSSTSAGCHAMNWAVENKRLPREGMQIGHDCSLPPCIHPDHLSEITPEENYSQRNCCYDLKIPNYSLTLWCTHLDENHQPICFPPVVPNKVWINNRLSDVDLMRQVNWRRVEEIAIEDFSITARPWVPPPPNKTICMICFEDFTDRPYTTFACHMRGHSIGNPDFANPFSRFWRLLKDQYIANRVMPESKRLRLRQIYLDRVEEERKAIKRDRERARRAERRSVKKVKTTKATIKEEPQDSDDDFQ